MKRLVTTFVALVALPSLAAAVPIPGTYTSTDLGGPLSLARTSTSRPTVNSGLPQISNVASWDGSVLGAQYTVNCGVATVAFPPNLSQYNAITGNGFIGYHQEFAGGTFNFSPGPWGSGSGTMTQTTVDIVVTMIAFNPVASRANVFAEGVFAGGCTLRYVVANGTGVCETPFCPSLPPNYPAFLDPACAPTRIYGTWGDLSQIQLLIDCATKTQSSTWGTLKTMYR